MKISIDTSAGSPGSTTRNRWSPTTIAESEQYYHALKLRQVDTMLVRIPEASHSIYARPSQLIAKVDNILAWFEKYREEKAGDETTSED